MKLALGPTTSSEDVVGRETSFGRRHFVPEEHSMLDGHGPERGVSHFRPMNGRMEHHCARYLHDGADGSLGDAIVVMGAWPGVADRLSERLEVTEIISRCERAAVIRQEGLRDNAMIAAHQLEGFLALDCLVGVQVSLKLNVNVPGGMIDEDTPACILIVVFLFAFRGEETTLGGADEVIDGRSLTGQKVIGLENVRPIANGLGGLARSRSAGLLAELTGGTSWRVGNLAGGRVKSSAGLRAREDAGSHQRLDPLKTEVA